LSTQVTTGFDSYELGFLPFMVVGGVLDGIISSILLDKVTNKHIEQDFSIGIIAILY